MDRPKRTQRLSSVVLQYGLRTYHINSCRSFYKKIAAYRVETDKGQFFLKSFQGPQAQLERLYRRTSRLRRHDFNSMPEWLSTTEGNHWTSQDGRLYYVTDWIEGSRLGEDEKDHEKLGEVLAKLHLLSRRPSSGRPSFTKLEISRFKHHHRKFKRKLRTLQKNNHEFGRWLKEQGDQILSLTEEAWKTLTQKEVRRTLRNDQPSLIHGDVTRPNVIVHPGNVYLVDWDRARRGSTYYEVAKTLNNITGFSVPLMKAFLEGYEKHCPLTPEKRLIISSLCRLPREAWLVSRQIRSSKSRAILKVLKETWPKRMEAVQWLDAWARQQPQIPNSEVPSVPQNREDSLPLAD